MRRFHFLTSETINMHALWDSGEPASTKRVRYWVSVVWPNTGGLVMAEWDTSMYGFTDENELVPDDVSPWLLCTNMEEKARILKERFQGKFWSSVKEYWGNAFIRCWELKEDGEVEALQQTWPLVSGLKGH
jgi:hypothetical protein